MFPAICVSAGLVSASDVPPAAGELAKTCFQTGAPYADWMNVRSDVAIVYGVDPSLPPRIESWRKRGYRIHVMTGVSWGQYQDYLYGRFDGVNHEDEAQTDRAGNKISHGGDVYYMSPGESYGKFLCLGVKRALDAGAEAIHLEEPEFWVRSGYEERFKAEWEALYHQPWQPPDESCEAQWKASKLKYFLYRRALQQVFDFVRADNEKNGRGVKCFVASHSLLNYAHWRIVSPESSLAQLKGCDGFVAQVWTGTARTPNVYRGVKKERTFETAFLEYGAMQNLVHATGSLVWYLNDPVEDDPHHDWGDYRRNWECTLTASLFQPEVDHFEVMPWPERVWHGLYASAADPTKKTTIPPDYASELQVVCRALGELTSKGATWADCTRGVGVAVSDSLMFERGGPTPSDPDMGHFYGLALPLLKRGIPVQPVQLENLAVPGYLSKLRVLVASYRGQKPLSEEPHRALAAWVRKGGVLVFVDDDGDPFNAVPEWWNDKRNSTPRERLFESLGVPSTEGAHPVGKGLCVFLRANPCDLAARADDEDRYVGLAREACAAEGVEWRESASLILRRGKYVVAAGLDESPSTAADRVLSGRFVNLFDPDLKPVEAVELSPGSRFFLVDLDKVKGDGVVAAGCHVSETTQGVASFSCAVEGVEATPGVVLLQLSRKPAAVELGGRSLDGWTYDGRRNLLWIRFQNSARAQELVVRQSL
jgi:hypothetical protein